MIKAKQSWVLTMAGNRKPDISHFLSLSLLCKRGSEQHSLAYVGLSVLDGRKEWHKQNEDVDKKAKPLSLSHLNTFDKSPLAVESY